MLGYPYFANAVPVSVPVNGINGEWTEGPAISVNGIGFNVYANAGIGVEVAIASTKPDQLAGLAMDQVPAGPGRFFACNGGRLWLRSMTADPTTCNVTPLG